MTRGSSNASQEPWGDIMLKLIKEAEGRQRVPSSKTNEETNSDI